MLARVTDREGCVREFHASSLASLYETLCSEMIIEATCGGCASCGTCHIYLPEDSLESFNTPTEEEQAALEGLLNQKTNSRLLCQLKEQASIPQLHITIAPQE